VVLSRAKSGRTWLRVMLSRLYQRRYGLPESRLIEYDDFHRLDPAVPIVHFTHGHYLLDRLEPDRLESILGARRLLFLVRHPCDVAVSEYFQSTRRASEHKAALHGVDRDAPIFDFVMRSPLGLPAIVDYLNAWAPRVARLEQSRVVRYEDLRAAPVEELAGICSFLKAPFTAEEIREAAEFAAFENLQKLERSGFFDSHRLTPADPQDVDSFKVRRGKVGGYRDYFDDEQIAVMDTLVRKRLDPTFGYLRA
jgi:alcohol sulfotransferase